MIDISKSLKKDRELWIKIMDCCTKQSKKPGEVISEVTELIRRQNKKKYDEMTNQNTPNWRRTSIWFEFFIEDYLMALTGTLYHRKK